jgi:hypothetical protein
MRTLIIAAVASMGMAGIALADEAKGPAVMTDAQMDSVVAGAGRVSPFGSPNPNLGDPPWSALVKKGRVSPFHFEAGPSGIVVLIPR